MDGDGAPESMRVRKPPERGRGTRRANAAASTTRATARPSTSRGVGKTGGGRGRGRGRGRNTKKRGRGGAAPGSDDGTGDTSMFDDDEDELLVQVASNYEFQTSEIAQGFIALNKEVDLPGFDKTAGGVWIYPTNKPVRDYQFNIVQTALFHNTLVGLPTGLGKTFIAAVVMFNFSRWYPDSLIVFMAPTRPLVAQQLEACHSLMGIPPSKMMELTGNIPPKKREEIWKEKSVLFLTPQVMSSDMARGYCPAEKVRLVVVDEAHRSQGNYSYVQVIAKLIESNKCFRTLGLSATPGNDAASVQEVFKNLLISRVELRSDSSPDILPYTQKRDVETIIVKLDAHAKEFHNQIVEIFQRYTGKLLQQKAIPSRGANNISQYQLIKARETFRATANVPAFRKGLVELDFATAISLAHSVDLINTHGLRSVYSYLQGVMTKEKGQSNVTAELKRNTDVEEILGKLRSLLKITSDDMSMKLNATGFLTLDDDDYTSKSTVTSSTSGENVDYFISHPKFKALREIVQKHFETYAESNQSTRVMIFSQYRDSVQEIGSMLSSLRPLVKPMVFVGQSSGAATGRGLKQREQVQVVQKFREGGYNVLISTSVGEEGLDIGEVDLIVCFDCIKSPTRLIQRMGRTGRQRQGRTVFLLTFGKEESMYRASVFQSANMNKNILDTTKFDCYLYKESPRMIPPGIDPQCYKMDIILSSEQGQISNRGQRKTSVGPSTSKGCGARKEHAPASMPGSLAPELTLTQCFKKGKDILKKSSKTSAVSPAKFEPGAPEVILVEDADDCTSVSEFVQNIVNTVDVDGWKEADFNTFCKIFNIESVRKDATAECIRVAKLPKSIKWKEEFNHIDSDKLILDEREVGQVVQEAKTVSVGDQWTACDCGLPYVPENNLDDGERDMGSPSDATEQRQSQGKDFTATGEDLFGDWTGDDDIDDMELAQMVQYAEEFENQQQQDNLQHNDNEKKDNCFGESSIPDFDVGFLLEDGNETGDEIGKTNVNTTSSLAESPLSPIIPTRASRLLSRGNKTPERLASLFQKDVEEKSPVVKSDRVLSPTINSQRLFITDPCTPERNCADYPVGELSPIITGQRLIRTGLRTPEIKVGDNPAAELTDDMFVSPVFTRRPSLMAADISPILGNTLCASTPLRNQKDNDIKVPGEDKQESSTTDSDEILLPSPETKSVPVIVPANKQTLSGPIFNPFKVPTPLRQFIKRFNFPKDPASASASNTKSEADSCKLEDGNKNRPKGKIVFKEKVQHRFVNPRIDELPSVSLAAALGTAPPPGSVDLNKSIRASDVSSALDDLINSQKDFVNPLSAQNHLRALSKNRVRDSNQPSTSRSCLVKVDRPKPRVHFESEKKSYDNDLGVQPLQRNWPTLSKPVEKDNQTRIRKARKKRRTKANPFVEDEASVSGDESSSGSEHSSNSETEEDSFVEDADESVTESQQIRYLRSTREMPVDRVERPLEPQRRLSTTLIDATEADYERDSFCVDEVDYVDVGTFTQAMTKARVEVQKEMQENKKKRKARLDSSPESPASEPRPPPAPARMNLRSRKRLFSPSPSPSPERTTKTRRKRIIEYSSEDDNSD